MNQGAVTETPSWEAHRAMAVGAASATAFLFALVFLAAWPWEIFQRVLGVGTLVLGASVLMLGLGMFRGALRSPWRICLPGGLGLPIALIAFACLQSALHSADPAASKALIIKYVWYLLLFGAAVPLFSRPGDAVLAWQVFALSAGLVGVYAVCCAAGWLPPALAGTHEYFGRRLTEDVRVGAFVRIAATTPDYNQAILPMLAALPFLLVWASSSTAGRVGRIAAAVLAVFVVAGVAVSFSRSGLLAVAGVFAGGGLLLVWRWGRRNVGQAPPPVDLEQSPQIEGEEATSPGRLSPTTPFKDREDRECDKAVARRSTSPAASRPPLQRGTWDRCTVEAAVECTPQATSVPVICRGGLGQPPPPVNPRLPSRKWRLALLAGMVIATLCLVAAMVAGGYADMLVRRAMRGFNSPDPSYRSRLYVFGLAFKLLPKYALFGCGIGASGATLGAVAEPGRWLGTAIHSMPLMMWFETGILGLVGCLWLWWKLVRRVWTGLLRNQEPMCRRLGLAALGALSVLFWMTAIQPFQELSLFPILAALIVGPMHGKAGAKTVAQPDRSGKWRIALACAMALVILIVAKNIGAYQSAVSAVSRYAAELEDGLAAEQRGDWETARTAYERAEQLATHAPHHGLQGSRMQYMPYYGEAFRAADLEFVFLRLPGRGGRVDLPDEIAGFGVSRCLWNAGKTESALKRLQCFPLGTCWPESAYAVGEIYWRQGQYETALKLWRDAARLNRERKPFPPLEYPFDVSPSMDDIYQKLEAEVKPLADAAEPADIARRVAALLRLDRQEEAVNALKAAPAAAPELAIFRDALRGHQ